MIKTVINADDFGIDLDRDLGIVLCSLLKTISSFSVIVTNHDCYCRMKRLIKIVRILAPNVSIGLHLNLTDEPFLNGKLSDICKIEDDSLHPKIQYWIAAINGSLYYKTIEKEIHDQISKFNELFRSSPTHIDGHNHCHVADRKVFELTNKISAQNGIHHVRIPNEQFSDQLINKMIKLKYSHIDGISKQHDHLRQVQKFSQNDANMMALSMRASPMSDIYLYQYACSYLTELKREKLFIGTVYGHVQSMDFMKQSFENIGTGKIVELMVHPGLYFPIKHKTWFSNRERFRELVNLIKLKHSAFRKNKLTICNQDGHRL